MRKFYAFITVIVVLSLLVTACGSRRPGPVVVVLGPSIASIAVPSGLNAGDPFTFSATTTGTDVVAWSWNFGGGADPNTSILESPMVTLVNPSTDDPATYTVTLIVTDADGRTDTFTADYTVERTLNTAPEFVGDIDFAVAGNAATVTFTIVDADLDDVEITLTLVSGNVNVSPTAITATSANYGPFNISVSNDGVEDEVVSIDIALDDGINAPVIGNAGGTIAGIPLDPDTIYIIPSADTVNVGDRVRIVVYVGSVANELTFLPSCEIAYSDNWTPDDVIDETADPPILTSWNLGAPGGGQWFKDGFWANVPSSVLAVPAGLFWSGDTLAVSVNAYDPTGEGNIVGAPAGSSGALFSAEFIAATAGTGTFDFVHVRTYYKDSDGTDYFFTAEVNATVTINN